MALVNESFNSLVSLFFHSLKHWAKGAALENSVSGQRTKRKALNLLSELNQNSWLCEVTVEGKKDQSNMNVIF